ncbi:hypothetical protein MRB53_011587 [Persea americana]|uniref:Uncharacterized protein n=1 Tax=Persea americana TaxID=3435 RepID=A0ACC2LVD9_PERAE|nr:hypothetical protein MRB53_011587 [Persea americana]
MDYFIVHFHKRLTRSDVKENLNRLLIPKDVAHKTLIPEMGFEDAVKAEKGPLRKGIKLVGLIEQEENGIWSGSGGAAATHSS